MENGGTPAANATDGNVLAPADDHERLRDELAGIDDAWGDRPLIDPR